MIDHSLLHPTMNDSELAEGILLARRYDVATVCIKPYVVIGHRWQKISSRFKPIRERGI